MLRDMMESILKNSDTVLGVEWKSGPNSSELLLEREAGVRAALFQNPGKLWDAKADGVLPPAGNWSKTGADPIFDHNQKTS